jgi:signal transduction histidine kinase
VLVNLLGNAVKYTDVGGKLQLSVEREAGLATIRVHDSGIGIARDVLPHVFEPFVQAESSLSRSKGGVGMGLALVRGLVESHGGRVSAASAGLGHGSQFTVHLPLTLG